jgi:hypothetical protein
MGNESVSRPSDVVEYGSAAPLPQHRIGVWSYHSKSKNPALRRLERKL